MNRVNNINININININVGNGSQDWILTRFRNDMQVKEQSVVSQWSMDIMTWILGQCKRPMGAVTKSGSGMQIGWQSAVLKSS